MASIIKYIYFGYFRRIFYTAIVSLLSFVCTVHSVNAEGPTCLGNITVLPEFSNYVQDPDAQCDEGTYIFYVYEDCPTNKLIFEVTGEGIGIENCGGELFSEGLQFGFIKGGNVEDSKRAQIICTTFLTSSGNVSDFSYATFTFLDVNEFPPQPVGELDLVQSLYPEENTKGSILDFEYQDLDNGEISSMTFSYYFDPAAADMFEIQEVGESTNYSQSYSIIAKNYLDFESNSYYSLQVTFTSEDVRGTTSSTDQVFIIFVTDLGDNPPVFTVFVPYANFSEGPPLEVFTVQAIDRDVIVHNHIKYEIVSGNELDYFGINEESGIVSTVREVDREDLDSVLFFLVIQATEYLPNGSVAPQPNSINETTTVRVDDVNDVPPTFLEDNMTLSYDENTPPGVIVMVIQSYDPDENDKVTYKISDNAYLQIEDENLGEISVKNVVDREVVDNFLVTLTIQDLVGQESAIDVSVTISDLNDNAPKITCVQSTNITEQSESGTPVETVSATDKDIGRHQEITYVLKNLNINDENKFAPFQVDEVTGEITVNSQDMPLDREAKSQWDLYIGAYDNCEDAEFKCSVNSDECVMTIYVIDVNDNEPGNFQLNIGGNTITTDESLRKDDQIPGLEILAFDPDEPMTPNSEIHFEVSHLFTASSELTNRLFEAENFNRSGSYYCYLYAIDDLTGLAGDYIITINASDHGSPELFQEHNFTLRINDVNDMTPEISFSDCLTSSEQTIILIENITVVDKPLPCTPDAIPMNDATIYVTDKDVDPPNSDIKLEIDYASSSAENGGGQLQAFVIYPYPEKGTYGISVNMEIDREKGSRYNLAIVAKDEGVPQLSSSSWVYIIVNDLNEYEPTFCDKAPCTQTLYITENTNGATEFLAATDFDNLAGDAPNGNTIYYFIVDDADHAFEISQSSLNEINPIINLDRESIGEYHFNILTTNSRINPNEYRTPNQILQVNVTIIDQNDNKPFYDEIIYGDFTNTNQIKDTVAEIEFTDVDLNETLVYTIGNDMVWSDGQSIADPFTIEPIDSRRSKLLLNMDPKGKIGYCTFTVNCQDAGIHKASASALVLVVTSNYIVLFYFLNDLSTVTYNSKNIEDIFTSVFGYTCIIDEISEAVDSNNNVIDGQTLVSAHFIEEIPVRVEEMTSSRMNGKGWQSSIQNRKALGGESFEDEEKLTYNIERNFHGIDIERKPVVNEKNNSLFIRREDWKENQNLKSTPKSDSAKVRENRSKISPDNEETNSEKPKNRFLGFISKVVGNKKAKPNVNKTFSRGRKFSFRASITYQLVPKEEIEMMGTQGSVTSDLTYQLNVIGLNLIRIGEVSVDITNEYHKQIVSLKIGLGVVALVLGLLTILLLIVYSGKTRKLNRQIKVLTTNTFGSKSSELNKIEADMSQIPGSNIYAKDGTNPIWKMEITLDGVNEDATSDTSGESIFEGVEEESPFKHFSRQNKQTSEQPHLYDAEVNKNENLGSATFESVHYLETPLSNGFISFGSVNPLIDPAAELFESSFNDNNSSTDRRTSSSISNDDGSGVVLETNFNSNFTLF